MTEEEIKKEMVSIAEKAYKEHGIMLDNASFYWHKLLPRKVVCVLDTVRISYESNAKR